MTGSRRPWSRDPVSPRSLNTKGPMSLELTHWAGVVSAEREDCRLPLRADEEAREIIDAALALLFPHFAPIGAPGRRGRR